MPALAGRSAVSELPARVWPGLKCEDMLAYTYLEQWKLGLTEKPPPNLEGPRDVLATGFWAARISDIKPEDTVLINRGRADGDMHIAVRDVEEACSDSSFSRGTARISLSRQKVWMGAMVTRYWLS